MNSCRPYSLSRSEIRNCVPTAATRRADARTSCSPSPYTFARFPKRNVSFPRTVMTSSGVSVAGALAPADSCGANPGCARRLPGRRVDAGIGRSEAETTGRRLRPEQREPALVPSAGAPLPVARRRPSFKHQRPPLRLHRQQTAVAPPVRQTVFRVNGFAVDVHGVGDRQPRAPAGLGTAGGQRRGGVAEARIRDGAKGAGNQPARSRAATRSARQIPRGPHPPPVEGRWPAEAGVDRAGGLSPFDHDRRGTAQAQCRVHAAQAERRSQATSPRSSCRPSAAHRRAAPAGSRRPPTISPRRRRPRTSRGLISG